MNRVRERLYVIGSILFFLTVITVILVGLIQVRQTNETEARRSFETIVANIQSRWRDQPLPEASRGMAELFFSDNPYPAFVSVYSFDLGIDYLWARDDRFLGAAGIPDVPVPPVINMNRMVHQQYTRTFTLSNGERRIVTAVFPVLDRESVFPILRNSLVAILAFLVLLLAVTLAGIIRSGKSAAPTSADQNGDQATASVGVASSIGIDPSVDVDSPVGAAAGDTSLLVPEDNLRRRLTLELERAAIQEQDISVAMFSFSGGTAPPDTMNAKLVTSFFGFADLSFRFGRDNIVIVFPSTTLSDTLGQIERFQRYYWEERNRWNAPNGDFSCGVSSRNGRLVSGDRVIGECRAALKRADRSTGKIVGFQPDPQRYRAYLRGTTGVI